jgi:hypothetical protein
MQWDVREGSSCSRRDKEGRDGTEWLMSCARCWSSWKPRLGLLPLVCCLRWRRMMGRARVGLGPLWVVLFRRSRRW